MISSGKRSPRWVGKHPASIAYHLPATNVTVASGAFVVETLLREAFPWDEAPQYLIRDRDAIFGKGVGATIKGMGIEAVVRPGSLSPLARPRLDRDRLIRCSH